MRLSVKLSIPREICVFIKLLQRNGHSFVTCFLDLQLKLVLFIYDYKILSRCQKMPKKLSKRLQNSAKLLSRIENTAAEKCNAIFDKSNQ